MTTYGITPAGFVLKRYEDCKLEIEATLKEVFGDDVNLDTGTTFGQFVNIWALREADQWAAQQATYDATRPASAVGVALDDILTLSGLTRFPSTSSAVSVCMFGADEAVVPQYFSVSDEAEVAHWLLYATTTISQDEAIKIQVHVDAAAAGDYTVTIDGVDYTYTAAGGDTVDVIVAALAAVLVAGLGANYVVSYDLDTDDLTIHPSDLSTPFAAALTGSLSYTAVGTLGLFYSETVGPIAATAGSLTKINTPDTPTSVVNFRPATRGCLVETDVEARLRRERSYAGIAGATPTAIETRIRSEVAGVSACHVFINSSDDTDAEGRPPHSVEAVVSGGADQDILDKLYEVMAGGPNTYGNVAGTITTSLEELVAMYFSRPDVVYVWVRYTLTYDPEVAFPVDGQDQIKAQLLVYGLATFPLGRDLAIDKFKVPVHAISGVRSVSVEIAVTSAPDDTPSFDTVDITLDPTQLPDFDGDHVTFVEA
jgi:hypothetical protein